MTLPIEFALASASIRDLDIGKETLPDSEPENIDLYADKADND